MAVPDKAAGAFRTIGELSRDTGIPQHILRYWESRFPQLRPLQRAGNRRYYRPADADLVRRIQRLLETEGYTIRGVQQLLTSEGSPKRGGADVTVLRKIRDALAAALADDAGAGPDGRRCGR